MATTPFFAGSPSLSLPYGLTLIRTLPNQEDDARVYVLYAPDQHHRAQQLFRALDPTAPDGLSLRIQTFTLSLQCFDEKKDLAHPDVFGSAHALIHLDSRSLAAFIERGPKKLQHVRYFCSESTVSQTPVSTLTDISAAPASILGDRDALERCMTLVNGKLREATPSPLPATGSRSGCVVM